MTEIVCCRFTLSTVGMNAEKLRSGKVYYGVNEIDNITLNPYNYEN